MASTSLLSQPTKACLAPAYLSRSVTPCEPSPSAIDVLASPFLAFVSTVAPAQGSPPVELTLQSHLVDLKETIPGLHPFLSFAPPCIPMAHGTNVVLHLLICLLGS